MLQVGGGEQVEQDWIKPFKANSDFPAIFDIASGVLEEGEYAALHEYPRRTQQEKYQAMTALLILTLVYISNQWARYLLSYLYSVNSENPRYSINTATGLSPLSYGTITGYVFTIAYVLGGLVAGRMVDKTNRRNLLCLGTVVWGLAMVTMALANNVIMLYAAMCLIALGSACNAPVAFSLLPAFFPVQASRGKANSVWTMGIYIGASMSSFSLILNAQLGWRDTCLAAAFFAFFVALVLMLLLPEPPRLQPTTPTTDSSVVLRTIRASLHERPGLLDSYSGAVRFILQNKKVLLLFLASSLRFVAGSLQGAFLPQFYQTFYPDYQDQFSLLNGLLLIFGGGTGALAGGVIADYWGRKNKRAWAWVPMIGSVLAIPLMGGLLFSKTFYVSIVYLGVLRIISESWLGCALAILQQELPTEIYGVSSSLFSACVYLLSSSAPFVAGWMIDASADKQMIVKVLISACGVSYFIAAICCFLIGHYTR
jgi:MFS family permease